ncbi:hypothetical protein GOV07_01875 [Candidatus Woesearchaeota archaeon]|nr:hypothetical protein [Candidatus Woesearchaeota archaeon]
MKEKVKHHGFAHFILFIGLFVLAVVIFGGVADGPLMSGLFAGAQVYHWISSGIAGDVESIGAAAPSILGLLVIFIINLAIYYVLSSVLIVLFNLVFGKEGK